jgi:hypothetical protein
VEIKHPEYDVNLGWASQCDGLLFRFEDRTVEQPAVGEMTLRLPRGSVRLTLLAAGGREPLLFELELDRLAMRPYAGPFPRLSLTSGGDNGLTTPGVTVQAQWSVPGTLTGSLENGKKVIRRLTAPDGTATLPAEQDPPFGYPRPLWSGDLTFTLPFTYHGTIRWRAYCPPPP